MSQPFKKLNDKHVIIFQQVRFIPIRLTVDDTSFSTNAALNIVCGFLQFHLLKNMVIVHVAYFRAFHVELATHS
jgi:hypothetical protein